MNRHDIYAAIDAEREQQSRQWNRVHDWGFGDCSSPHVAPTVKCAVLAEECGEVSRAVLDNDHESLRAELIQVAAVAVAWLEGI